MNLRPTTARDLARMVMDHAEAAYERGGWDMIVECMTLEEITAELIEERIDTKDEAIAWFARIAGTYDEQRRSVCNEIF